MFKILGIALVALVAAVLLYAGTRPDIFRIERSIAINTSADKVFVILNDFRQWGAWSPWENLDPAMIRKYSGAPAGKGAVYEWQGNSQVGVGRCEITEAVPSSKILMQLDYLKPFKAQNFVEFTLQPQNDATQVTWTMSGRNTYLSKLLGLLFTERMVGNMFERGLANLKTAAEKQG